MGVAAYGHFNEAPPTLAAFVKVLEDRFMPSDITNRLTEELGRLNMDGVDLNRNVAQFQAYCQHIQTTGESMLVMIFVRDSTLLCSTQGNWQDQRLCWMLTRQRRKRKSDQHHRGTVH